MKLIWGVLLMIVIFIWRDKLGIIGNCACEGEDDEGEGKRKSRRRDLAIIL